MRLTRREMIALSALTALAASAPHAAQPEMGRLRVRGGRVAWRRFGEGPKLPLIAIHGGPGFPSDYLEPLADLSDERPLILWDQLGCGRSDKPANPSLWTLERFVDELDAVRKALAPGPVHIVGHSWGSMLAMEWLVTRKPKDIASVVFAGECLSVPRFLSDVRKLLKSLSPNSQAVIAEAERANNYTSPEFGAAYQEFISRYVSKAPPGNKFMTRAVAGWSTEIYTHMWGPSEFTCTGALKTFDRTKELASLKMPVLFHSGEFDECRPETAREHAAMTPGAQFAMIRGAAHMTMIDEPDRCNQAIREFLKRVEA